MTLSEAVVESKAPAAFSFLKLAGPGLIVAVGNRLRRRRLGDSWRSGYGVVLWRSSWARSSNSCRSKVSRGFSCHGTDRAGRVGPEYLPAWVKAYFGGI